MGHKVTLNGPHAIARIQGGPAHEAIDESNTYNYAVEDGWLWIKMVDDDDCYPLQSESMTDEEREASLSEQTPPSFCPED